MFISFYFFNVGHVKESPMSLELFIFKKRIDKLEQIINDSMKLCGAAHTEELLQRLNSLQSIIQTRDTLNTGGYFEWVDSKIVQALKFGHFICLDHVNLCSSAVLDRLNSVFEKNGKLILSEKGGTYGTDMSECVTINSRFFACLTLDPKNGEISRAMRNRCIELNLGKDTYTSDDLKAMIYENGITDAFLMDWILRVHSRVCKLSETNQFSSSHLCKFAFLTNEIYRLGSSRKSSLFESAMEVYVRSSHTDLLGLGIDYYQDKMKDEICDELKKAPNKCLNIVNITNSFIRANNMNRLSLIQLQCEPMLLAINCLLNDLGVSDVVCAFKMLREKFSDLNINLSPELIKYLLYISYEMCSVDDVDLREQYLHRFLGNTGTKGSIISENLVKLNRNLASIIKIADINGKTSVPWNPNMMHRLRDYHKISMSTSKYLNLSVILLIEISLKPVEAKCKIRQSCVDVITYSKAVNQNLIPNILNIDLVTYLHPFLHNIKSEIVKSLQNMDSLDYERYSHLICSLLWPNRLYETSKSQLFAQKSVNFSVIDRLMLNLGWLMKDMIFTNDYLKLATTLESEGNKLYRLAIRKLHEYLAKNEHPLDKVRKQFVKKLTWFLPHYDEKQIQLHRDLSTFRKRMAILPPSGIHKINEQTENVAELMETIRILMSDEHADYRNYLLNQFNYDSSQDIFHNSYKNEGNSDEVNIESSQSMEKLPDCVEQFYRFCESMSNNSHISKPASISLLLSTIQPLEYFAAKAFNAFYSQNLHKFNYNLEYFKAIPTLDVHILKYLQIISTEQFKTCEVTWNSILEKILENLNLPTIVQNAPAEFYKQFSTFMRILDTTFIKFFQNSIAYNHHIISSVINSSNANSFKLSPNSATLTTVILDVLFNDCGDLKSPELADLDLFQETLESFSNILWNNIELFRSSFCFEKTFNVHSLLYAKKLLVDIRYIESVEKLAEPKEFCQEFKEGIEYLKTSIQLIDCEDRTMSNKKQMNQFCKSVVVTTLSAALELHLLTFMPLIDPVEKKNLKKAYVEEDISHLIHLLSAYDFMKTIMSYDGLGQRVVDCIRSKIDNLKNKLEKRSKRCALRPEICVYSELKNQTTFLLQTSFRLESLLLLVKEYSSIYESLENETANIKDLEYANEVIDQIDSNINIAESFQQSTIDQYDLYYHDLTAPLDSTITKLKFGLQCMKESIIRNRDVLKNSKRTTYQLDNIAETISNFVKFPNTSEIIPNNETLNMEEYIFDLMEGMKSKDSLRLS